MRNLIAWVIGITLFCWATVSAFSIFSELKFLVDGWTWSVGQVPITVKVIALAIGKYVSGIVAGYREFVHGLVAILHLPKLPTFVYESFGIVSFCIGRGHWLQSRAQEQRREYLNSEQYEMDAKKYDELHPHSGLVRIPSEDPFPWDQRFPILTLARKIEDYLMSLLPGFKSWAYDDGSIETDRPEWHEPIAEVLGFLVLLVLYGGAIAIVIAASSASTSSTDISRRDRIGVGHAFNHLSHHRYCCVLLGNLRTTELVV
jgi:hypothetical protein